MNDNKSLVSAGAGIARRNLRYIIWFYLLNLVFAWFGASGVSTHAHKIMDHSLYSDKLLRGFDPAAMIELIARPDFGPTESSTVPAMFFGILFVCASLTFMPGLLLGYSSDHRISRDEFFRACGRNLWRFARLFVLGSIVAGIVGGGLMAALDPLVELVEKTNYERLPFFTQLAGWAVILLLLTIVRIWFDLAQTDVVLRDQAAVRKSVAAAFRTMRKNFARLFGTYVATLVVALVVLASGIVLWNMIVPPSSVFGAFLVGQITMLLLLATRFWQRASAVAFYVREATEPVVEMPLASAATPAIAVS